MRPVWILLIVITGAAAAFALDMPVYHFVDRYSEPYGFERSQIVRGFQDFAQTVPPLAIAWAIWRLDRRRGRSIVLRLVLAFAMAGAVTGAVKLLVGRTRPEQFTGQTWRQTWLDAGLHSRTSKEQSFFSGHSGAAFAMATILAGCYPPVRPVVYTLAGGCALSRVVTEQHWLSDVYLGSITGVMLGWIFLPGSLRRSRPHKGLFQDKLAGQTAGTAQVG